MRQYSRFTKCGPNRKRGPRRAKTWDGLPDFDAAPPLPPTYRAGDALPDAELAMFGQRVSIQCRQPGWKARSDQVLALIDGEWRLVGAVELTNALRKLIARPTNKAVLAQIEHDAAFTFDREMVDDPLGRDGSWGPS